LTGSEAGSVALSDAGDRSETLSLRSHYLANMGAAASVTSSMWAEVCAQVRLIQSVHD
jgi:hypothetical protein